MALSDLIDHRESTELLDEFAKRERRYGQTPEQLQAKPTA